jgi:hypothetical protein
MRCQRCKMEYLDIGRMMAICQEEDFCCIRCGCPVAYHPDFIMTHHDFIRTRHSREEKSFGL